MQSPPAGPPPVAGEVKSHLWVAIMATLATLLCCCIPFGGLAIIPATMVSGKLQQGDITGARGMANLSLGISIVSLLLCFVVFGACLVGQVSTLELINELEGR